jgi:hypothetical protein
LGAGITGIKGESRSMNMTTQTDPITNHGFYVLGETAILLSHIPMFMPPHDAQAFAEVKFATKNGKDPAAIYVQDRKSTGAKVYTLKTDPLVLRSLHPTDPHQKPLTTFTGTIYRGNFLGTGTPLVEGVTINVIRAFYFHSFGEHSGHMKELSYYCFKTHESEYAAHLISSPPDFDQILTILVSGESGKQLTEGFSVRVEGRENALSAKLNAGETAVCRVSGRQHSVHVKPISELILESDSLAKAMPAAST